MVFSRFLRYFVEVARMGSIRRASEHLNVSASAIDRQILQAEAEMGVPLFERLPSGLRMTAAGELLLAAAKSWNKDYARLGDSFTDLVGLRRGTVRIACIEALSRGFLPRLVRDIRAEVPGVVFEIDVLDNKDVAHALVAGEADLGLMLSPQSSKDLAVRAFVDVEVGLITLPDHALARQKTAKFHQVAGLPMVLPKAPLALAELLQALAHATGIDMSNAASSDNVQMIKSLVESGVGIGVLSWLDVINEVEAGSLVFMRLTDAVLRPLNLSLCAVPNRQLSNAAMMVLSRIEASLTTLIPQ